MTHLHVGEFVEPNSTHKLICGTNIINYIKVTARMAFKCEIRLCSNLSECMSWQMHISGML